MPIAQPSLWPPTFDGAIFDFDGTIAETAYLWRQVDEAFLAERGIAYTDEYARMLSVLGFDRGARYTIDLYGLRETVEEVVEEWTCLSWALYRSEVTLKPGVSAYLSTLKARGIRCALATSNEPALIESMRNVDASALFDVLVYGCEVNVPKSEPDIYLEAARRMGVDPKRCIVFEDIAPGLEAANRAGFTTCAVRAEDAGQDWESLAAQADLAIESWLGIVR